jgi:hypothetical protein
MTEGDLDSSDMFAAAIADDTAPVSEAPAAEAKPPADTGPARDETGKFTKRADEAPETVETPAGEGDKPEPAIPSYRARELREERDRYMREAAEARAQMQQLMAMQQRQMQPQQPAPPPAPDIWDDPDKWYDTRLDTRLTPLQKEVQKIKEQISVRFAEQKFGPEKVQAAYNALKGALDGGSPQAQDFLKRLRNESEDPYGELVEWHNRSTTLREVGDVEAFKAKLRAEIEAEYAAKYGNGGASAAKPGVVVPPSLNRATASGSAPVSEEQADQSMFAYAIGR